MREQQSPASTTVSARSARFNAALFNYLNIVAMLVPVPLGILWLGASMLVYALNRHHPNERVGHYTQLAAYRLYGVAGAVVPVATFFGAALLPWLLTWLVGALIVIPWSILDLVRIYREPWEDVTIAKEEEVE